MGERGRVGGGGQPDHAGPVQDVAATSSVAGVTAVATGGDIRFGFIGAGMIARTALAPAVHAAGGAVLQAVASREADRARALEPLGRVHAGTAGGGGETAYAQLLDDPDVDVVYISLSNEAHVPWVIRSLQAGKHVVCEKPLGLDRREAARAFDAAAGADRLLVEAFFYRWHPRVRLAEQLIAQGELGDIVRVDSGFCFAGHDWSGAAAGNYRLDAARGGGALLDVGVYPLSVARWAVAGFGDSPVDIESLAVTWSGDLTPDGGVPVDLATDARLRSTGGPLVDLRCAMVGRDEQSVTVTGSVAALRLDGQAFTNRDAPSGLLLFDPAAQVLPAVESFGPVDPYRLMVEAVVAAVRGEPAFLVTREDSLAIAGVSDTIRELRAAPDHRVAVRDGVPRP